MDENSVSDSSDDTLRGQIRLLLTGGVVGAFLLAASLAVMLSGASAPEPPQLPLRIPALPQRPTDSPSEFPTEFPSILPSGFPTDFPRDLPTALPSELLTIFPSDLPVFPDLNVPGGNP
ncbi:hypothetical protein GCM10010116_35290 [Microbispora rosea subsp. aerata]|nr:hypothetical protein [Microbispora rosea]GGO17441.1 hypothetical protein GCM10010116_35290 [Microbispora rosea subsp. aerata]GIH56543.1 hypothetical protein Mro02_34570 [Microbispora rosea subsp. aerata]GLJ81928.1 hypothetical protein GCM10017588_06530 [Microbispora rosea subsp. aerata]